jgi:L-aspartate oxidase
LSLRERVQRTMSRHVAVVRDRARLAIAASEVDGVITELAQMENGGRSQWETANLALAARAVISAATLREESRGAHYRSDFPETNHELDQLHLVYGGDAGNVWRFSSLDEARAAQVSQQ